MRGFYRSHPRKSLRQVRAVSREQSNAAAKAQSGLGPIGARPGAEVQASLTLQRPDWSRSIHDGVEINMSVASMSRMIGSMATKEIMPVLFSLLEGADQPSFRIS